MPRQHAILNPSAAHRWLICTPSARLHAKLVERLGETESSFAKEGTLAHSLAELKLRLINGEINQFRFDSEKKLLGDIPAEMDRATDTYVDVILERLYAARKSCPDARLFIELRLDMSRWVPQCFGTSDAVIVSDETLEVCDLKYGKGVPVSAEENPQARLYALGAVDALGDLYSFRHARATIIQPRLDSVSEETLSKEDLLAWGGEIMENAQLAWRGEGQFVPGEHCRFCAAKAICAARALQVMKTLSTGFDSPDVIPAENIPGILKVADVAESWFKDIRAYAYQQAMAGDKIPGFKLVRGRAPARKWTSENEVIDQMARAGYSKEQYMDQPKLMSVAALEKSIGKVAFKALLAPLAQQGEAPLTLVPESDPREEFSSADMTFSDLSESQISKS